ncbi:MAG: stage 0 sporulation family protein [Clostridiales bacterium]|nr:stage 0 sporulation family protein [Clostridiales bacterium]MBR6484450.1 stage 0 sporulation family protein [Clostridiales bacterium]
MRRTVNLRFRDAGKAYRFTCDDIDLKIGDAVMVETSMGIDLAHVIDEPIEVEDSQIGEDVLPVLRFANEKELERYELKKEKEQEAYERCLQLIEKHQLDMNLIDAVFAFDGKKVIFYFTSDNRVDFRELVKDLAAAFRARIELRQIGSRDQAKLVGGIGICGRELCCCTFLNHFAPVTLRMARDQGMSLNPTKLNGACGRLMCCLQFEKEAYADAHKRLPKTGKKIRTPHGVGVVSDVNLLTEKVTVKFTHDDMDEVEVFDWEGLEPLNCGGEDCPGCDGCPAGS